MASPFSAVAVIAPATRNFGRIVSNLLDVNYM